MNRKSCLGVVLAKGWSGRIRRKNLSIIGDKQMFLWAAEVLKRSGICDHIVISTDSKEIYKLSLERGYFPIMRDSRWDDDQWQFNGAIHGTIERYEAALNCQFDNCCMILGNSIFARASWFRVALDLLKTHKVDAMRLTHVYPTDCVDSMCTVFRILRFGCYFPHRLPLPHVGVNLDIDFPRDLTLARALMPVLIEQGYFADDEMVHEFPDQYENLLAKSQVPRFVR